MVNLEPLDEAAAGEFLATSLRRFLTDVMVGATPKEIETQGDRLRQRLVPDGIDTSGHHFDAVVSDGQPVGIVWFGPFENGETACYIYDLEIDANRRREGHARAAVTSVVRLARTAGASRLGLAVQQSNIAAVALYESLGFVGEAVAERQFEMWLTLDVDPS